MMRRWRLRIKKVAMGAVMAMAVVILPTGMAGAGEALGTWVTEGGKSHVTIAACGERLCGKIVWLKEPLNDKGAPKHDANNPDKTKQSRPIVGLPLLVGFVADEVADNWVNGTIYNPEDGEIYSCNLTLLDPNTLKVRGYVGMPMFGKTQIWIRAN